MSSPMDASTPAHAMAEAEKDLSYPYAKLIYWCAMAIVRCLCDIADAVRNGSESITAAAIKNRPE